MTIQEEIPQQNPFEDQRKQALELYENMAKECHHCSSFIQRAIESYNPDLQAQLSAKSQEIVNLERGIAGYSKEVSELQKIASDQDTELSTLRAENERLNDDNKKLISGNAELCKRCEDLEGLLKEWLSQYGWPGKSLTIDTKKLLNQIKS